MENDIWISPNQAVNRLKPRFGDQAKAALVDRCARGLLDGRGEIVVRTYENCFQPIWHSYLEKHYGEPIEDTRDLQEILPPSFWDAALAGATVTPVDATNGFHKTVWADWDIGDFGYRDIQISDDISGVERCDVAGMMFNSQQLELLCGRKEAMPIEQKARKSFYDWEDALIALCGVLSQGILVPDAFAHGAQADIEKWFSEWFAENFSSEPHESTIRPKAKRVLLAMKEEQVKADKASERKK